jgi:SNF2 family DNA or RNA helicase
MELYEHQEELIKQAKPILEKYKMVYIAAETRTGKTLAAIHLLKDDFKKILVVTKKKAISSWNSDIKLSKVKNFDVINYESIHKMDSKEYDVIVLDEAHSIGSYPKPSQRAKQLKEMAKDKSIVYLSATPSAETYSQIFHQLWVSSFTPFVEKSFYQWYKNYGEDDSIFINGMFIKRYKASHGEMIMEVINHLIVTMTKEKANFDVFVNERIHQVEVDEDYLSALEYFKSNRIITIDENEIVAETSASALNKLHQLNGGTIKVNDKLSLIVSHHKVNYIKENLGNDEKIVILCNYIKERDLLLTRLANSTDEVEKFKNQNFKYFIGHIKTFSGGVDFSYADSMIIYSLNFSATTYLQSKERLANKKRVKPIVVHYLFTKGGIDEYIYQAVSNKMNFTNSYYKSCR